MYSNWRSLADRSSAFRFRPVIAEGDMMPNHVERLQQLWNGGLGVGALIFVILLCNRSLRYLRSQINQDYWADFMKNYGILLYGIPIASTASFCIVTFFGVITPGDVEFKIWEFTVKGPSGSIMMFVIVFLAFILAILALRPK
jgi:hypothetical protein